MLGEFGGLGDIFGRPGSAWTQEERFQVVVLLHGPRVLRQLLAYCLWHLGRPAMPEDAEDAWGDYVVPKGRQERSRLDAVIDAYDPGRTPGKPGWEQFRNLLLSDLARHCWRRGARMRHHLYRFPPLPQQPGDGAVEFEIVDRNTKTGEQEMIRSEESKAGGRRLEHRRQRLLECLSQLLPAYRSLIIAHHFEGKTLIALARQDIDAFAAVGVRSEPKALTDDEQAKRLAKKENALRQRVFRARNALRQCIVEREATDNAGEL